MALPEAVQKQVEEAEALHKQLYEVDQTPEAPAKDAGNTGATTDDAPSAEAPPATAKEVPTGDENSLSWKQRYDVLTGKYNAEVPRLHQQLRELTAGFQQLQQEHAQALSRLNQQTSEAARTEPDKDAEVFGEDLTEAMDRRARRMAEQMIEARSAELRSYIAQLEARLKGVDDQMAATTQERFLAQLSSKVADWETINQDQGFLAWLGEADPIYGMPRQAALDSAAKALDVDRTASIFLAYKAQTARPSSRSNELQRQVTPSATRSAATTPGNSRIWSGEEYARVYDPRYAQEVGAAEAARQMAEADLAVAENRVRW